MTAAACILQEMLPLVAKQGGPVVTDVAHYNRLHDGIKSLAALVAYEGILEAPVAQNVLQNFWPMPPYCHFGLMQGAASKGMLESLSMLVCCCFAWCVVCYVHNRGDILC